MNKSDLADICLQRHLPTHGTKTHLCAPVEGTSSRFTDLRTPWIERLNSNESIVLQNVW